MGNVFSIIDSLTLACFDRVRPAAPATVTMPSSAGSVGSTHKRRGTSIARGESMNLSDTGPLGTLIQSGAQSDTGIDSRRSSISAASAVKGSASKGGMTLPPVSDNRHLNL